MLGTLEDSGIMTLTIKELFRLIETKSSTKEYKIKFFYLEIYNEMIRDLLGEDPTEVLELREDPIKGLAVAGLSERVAEDLNEIMKYLIIGNKNRTQESTRANKTSSRSHVVFQITVEYTKKDNKNDIEPEMKSAKLSLIDLAGSERAAQTCNRGMRMIEGANINKSLLALGNCINKLSEQTSKGVKVHIPYRDSKLTRLLKDSLSGSCRTMMIANISPSNVTYEDTYNTLNYANRAKNIKTELSQNIHTAQDHILQYTAIIKQLQREIASLRKQVAKPTNSTLFVYYLGIPPDSKEMEENLQNTLNSVNEHYEELSNVQKSLCDIRQRIETANLAIAVKKTQSEISDDPKLLKDISSDELQLKEFHISEQVLINRMKELQEKRTHILERIPMTEGLSSIINQQIDHERQLMQQIPIEGFMQVSDIEELAKLQETTICKLKEQLELRDVMLKKIDVTLDVSSKNAIVSYKDLLEKAKDEHSKGFKSIKHTANKIRTQNSKSNIRNGRQPSYIREYIDEDKKNSNIGSQESSFLIRASSEAVPIWGNHLPKNSESMSIQTDKMRRRRFVNNGSHIIIGSTKDLILPKKPSFVTKSEVRRARRLIKKNEVGRLNYSYIN